MDCGIVLNMLHTVQKADDSLLSGLTLKVSWKPSVAPSCEPISTSATFQVLPPVLSSELADHISESTPLTYRNIAGKS